MIAKTCGFGQIAEDLKKGKINNKEDKIISLPLLIWGNFNLKFKYSNNGANKEIKQKINLTENTEPKVS